MHTHTHTHTPPQGVLDRFSQIKPKVIFSIEAVRYNNKVHSHMEKLRNVVAGMSPLCTRLTRAETVIVL